MRGKVFLDTNVLIYAATSREPFPDNFARAADIIAKEEFGISTQVVGEFVRNVQNSKKMKSPLADEEVDGWIERLYEFPVISIDREIILNAMLFQRRCEIEFWDGQILAAAHRFGADTLLTESLNDGQIYGSVRCENPFRDHQSVES